MEDTGFSESSLPLGTPRRRGSKRFIYLIVTVILLIAIIFAATRFLSSDGQKEEEKMGPTPTEYQIPTDTPVPATESATPSVSAEPTKSSTGTSSIDKATGLDRSKLSVEIQNGSGVAGVANKASTFLKDLGYNVVSTGNADTFDYEGVTVQVKKASSSFLTLLKKDLGTDYTVNSATSDLSASSSADALVIIGK